MMSHPTPLAWSYIVLFGGIAIVLIAFAIAVRSRRNASTRDPRLAALEDELSHGEISREDYEKRRAEIIIEQSEKHRAA